MTFQNVRWTEGGAVLYDGAGHIRGLTRCNVELNEQDAVDVGDYVNRFGLQDATVDAILSMIFEMGLREMKRQTDLDRFMCEHEKVSE